MFRGNEFQKKYGDDVAAFAYCFALAAHGGAGNVRKYTGEHYIEHPIEVVKILRWFGEYKKITEKIVTAALLHDVVEDTHVSLKCIQKNFGEEIAKIVEELTDEVNPELNRAARNALRIERLANASYEAQTIKCADIISNARSIHAHDKRFWVTFKAECLTLLNAMIKADDGIRKAAFACLFDLDNGAQS
jgi:(p)ppGpp synthase/HD superfamily hydrolase